MTKRRFAGLAALALVLATLAVACGGDDDEGGGGGNDLLASVEDRGTLKVSTDPAYPPQSKLNEKTG